MKDQSKYDNMTKDELYQKAREKNIADKSSKNKEELKEALEKSEKQGQISTEQNNKKEESKAGENKREQLLEFIDKKAFDPVLNASEKNYKGDQRKKLEDVQSTTRSTKKRYHKNYKTAEDVKQNFESDLNSSAANQIDKELKDLGLPTLPGIHQEFMELSVN